MVKKKYSNSEDAFNKQVYFIIVLPAIFGVIAVAGPKWSSVFAIFWVGALILLLLWTLFSNYRKRYRDPKWRALFAVINCDLAALFILFPCWRVTGERIWLLVILLCAYVYCIWITHRNRSLIFKNIFGSKKSRFRSIFFTTTMILIVFTGGGSYGFARSLQVFYGYSTALVILSFCLLPFAFFFIITFHCIWYKVEHPERTPG